MIELNNLIGKQFIDGGRGPDTYDCFGLLVEIYRQYGCTIPTVNVSVYACQAAQNEIDQHKNIEWHEIKIPVVPCAVLLSAYPGWAQHIGIYIGNNKFIHINKQAGVCVDRLDSPQWKMKFEGFWQYDHYIDNSKSI